MTSTQRKPRSRTNSLALSPTREQIATRAFEIFVQRGGMDGFADDDWFRAEAELRAEMADREKPASAAGRAA